MGRLLGIDHGDRRIGIALSDPIPIIASPLKTISINSQQEAVSAILELIDEYDIEMVVIGNPIGMKGNQTAQTVHVKKFADELIELGVKIAIQDERLSSVSAKKSLQGQPLKIRRNKGMVDQTAAAILLQQYIDRHYHA